MFGVGVVVAIAQVSSDLKIFFISFICFAIADFFVLFRSQL